MKILIISAYFPPYNSIASLRPYSWAKYWSRLGHDVTVIALAKGSRGADLVMPYRGFNVVSIREPLLLSKDHKPSRNKAAKSSIRRKIAGLFNKYGIVNQDAHIPNLHDLWALYTTILLIRTNWDLTVSTALPYSSHIPAYFLKKSGQTKVWIADWRDLWSSDPYHPPVFALRKLENWIEGVFHSTADLTTTVSEPLARHIQQKCSRAKIEVIYNGFDPDDYEQLSLEPVFKDNQVFRIVYTGTIYKQTRNPAPLFRAIKLLEQKSKITPSHLRLLFAGFHADVTDIAEEEGVSAYVEYVGAIPRPDVLRIQHDCDALLFLEDSESVGVLTGKLFEYLVAGPPIIAIGVDSTSSAGQLIEYYGCGKAYGNDVDKIAEGLLRLMADKDKRAEGRSLPLSLRRFSRKEEAERLLSLAVQLFENKK